MFRENTIVLQIERVPQRNAMLLNVKTLYT
jgi:hypothetical protein